MNLIELYHTLPLIFFQFCHAEKGMLFTYVGRQCRFDNKNTTGSLCVDVAIKLAVIDRPVNVARWVFQLVCPNINKAL